MTQRIGVIDIGSNSVRLVIFETSGRCIRSFFNEKVLAGLGRSLEQTGHLNVSGKTEALSAIRRFRAVLNGQGVSDIRCFATAAVRDAADGAEFSAMVRNELGENVRILSGQDEARLAATGVIAMKPEAEGICGDLGGSSLELSSIVAGHYAGGATYPLGPLALGRDARGDGSIGPVKNSVLSRIDEELADAPELAGAADTFFMVGGAWRAIARIHMEEAAYPLRLLQQYEIASGDIIELTKKIMSPKDEMQERITAIGGRRASVLPVAAAVLNRVVKRGGFNRVITSSYGVREGVVFSGMDEALQRSDPLPAAMRVLVSQNGELSPFAASLSGWLSGASQSTLPARLAEAACMAADSGALFHPDHRADMAFEWLVTAPVTGVDHEERAAIALAVASRYSRGFRHSVSEAILSGEMRGKARALGSLMRLAADFSGRTSNLLKQARLFVDNNRLILEVANGKQDLVSEMVTKRLHQAAALLQMTPEMRASDDFG